MNKEVIAFRMLIGFVIAMLIAGTLFIYDFYHDYKCSMMSHSDMVKDHSCDKYWKK